MTTKKTASPVKSDNKVFKVEPSKDTPSQTLAKLATTSVLSAITLQSYSGAGDALEVSDLVAEMRKAGDEAVAGELGRVERMLANQALILDAIFNNMAQRSFRQESFKGIEVLMRLALKAQAQARSTAEALALLKNPMPYIRQANISNGPQQVNNGQAQPAPAGNSQILQNELLEHQHGDTLEFGAQGQAGQVDRKLEAVAKRHRPAHA